MGARSRIWRRAETEQGEGQTISLIYTTPFNATLLQWSFSISDIPTTTEFLTVTKISAAGNQYNVTIAQYCPSTDQTMEYLCNPNTELMLGDSVEIIFANTDDLGIGVEIVLTEGE